MLNQWTYLITMSRTLLSMYLVSTVIISLTCLRYVELITPITIYNNFRSENY